MGGGHCGWVVVLVGGRGLCGWVGVLGGVRPSVHPCTNTACTFCCFFILCGTDAKTVDGWFSCVQESALCVYVRLTGSIL